MLITWRLQKTMWYLKFRDACTATNDVYTLYHWIRIAWLPWLDRYKRTTKQLKIYRPLAWADRFIKLLPIYNISERFQAGSLEIKQTLLSDQ